MVAMSEHGAKEGLQRVARRLEELARKQADAWKAAAFVVAQRTLDATIPGIPVRSGELADSGFVQRTDPVVAGFGSNHAAVVHELDGGRGFKFYQRAQAARQPHIASEMAALVEDFASRGVTLETAPSNYPTVPATRERPASQRRRSGVTRVRAGARRTR